MPIWGIFQHWLIWILFSSLPFSVFSLDSDNMNVRSFVTVSMILESLFLCYFCRFFFLFKLQWFLLFSPHSSSLYLLFLCRYFLFLKKMYHVFIIVYFYDGWFKSVVRYFLTSVWSSCWHLLVIFSHSSWYICFFLCQEFFFFLKKFFF